MYSAIKIGGFALSIAACLLIALYIRDELRYDKNWAYADRTYRITSEYKFDGKVLTGADWPAFCQGCINEPGEGVEDGVEPPLKDCEGLKGNMDQGKLLGLFVFNL